jgi:hypothetical protein
MHIGKSLLGCSLLIFLLGAVGCETPTRSKITNLTPSVHSRNPNNLYPFSVAFSTRQYTLKQETLKAYVVIGTQSYPMQPTPLVVNRWETLVPIPADKKTVLYHYKFTYDFKRIPETGSDSKLSPEYRLEIK